MLKLVSNQKIDLSFDFNIDNRKFISSSPCIVKHPNNEEQYIVIVRCNYGVPGGNKTNNYILYLNKQFEVLEKKIIQYNFHPNKTRDGIEDVRLFWFDNKLYYTGTFKSKIDKTSSSIFQFPNVVDTLRENIIDVSFPTNYIHEKNWALFNYRDTLCVVYRWYPLQIGKIDYTNNSLILLEEKPMPNYFKNTRGSSCGILYDEFIWFIVHEQYLHITRKYIHFFVVFDQDMKLVKYSENFIFEKDREFAYGFLIENDTFIVSYSTDNSTSNIATYDYSYIRHGIQWITCNG
jgi:hypothetical protein